LETIIVPTTNPAANKTVIKLEQLIRLHN
jgi:hypothetical protein